MKHCLEATTTIGLAVFLVLSNPKPSIAFSFKNPRDLKANELLAPQNIFQLNKPWGLSSTLEGANSFATTFDFPFPAGTRKVTGSRNFISTATSYEQQFAGKYEDAPPLRGWSQRNLYDDSLGEITPEWGQVPGWKTITGAKALFNQVWNLTKTILAPGEMNCPTSFNGKAVTRCPVVETWWGAALDIKAGASLEGSIANSALGTELTSLTLQLDRVLDYSVDSKSYRIGSINSGVYELKLTDASSGLQDINIKFNATINGKQAQLQLDGDTVWRIAGIDIETSNPSYQLQVGTETYLTQDVRSLYAENLVDFPSNRLGILINNGTGALGSAFMGASNPLSDRQAVIKIETVPGPLPILGLGAFLGYSRKLRKLIKTSKPEMTTTHLGRP